MSARRLPLLIAVAIVALDQLTKWWVVSALQVGETRSLIPRVLYLHRVENSGAAFGLLPGWGSFIALGAIATVVLIFIVVRRLPGRLEAVALGLVLGGALGNLIDRLFRGPGLLDGKVVDFLRFDFYRSFPAFNVADTAITVGAALAVLAAFALSREEGEAGGPAGGGHDDPAA